MSSIYKTKRVEPPKAKRTVDFSPEKIKVIEKMCAERDAVLKQSKYAESQESHFSRKLSSAPTYQAETMYGSGQAEALFAQSQDKYHAARWRNAKNSIRRRYARLVKLIDRKTR